MDKLRYLKLVHEEWPSIERNWQAAWGESYTVPPRVRKAIEENLRGKLGGEPYDLEEVTEALRLQEEFRAMALPYVAFYRTREKARDLRSALKSPLPPEDTCPRWSEKAKNRSLELVAFVAERILPFKALLRGELKPGHRGPRVRIPWDELAEEWNRGHARGYDSGNALREAYHSATAGRTVSAVDLRGRSRSRCAPK